MALKTIVLGLAERQIAQAVLADVPKVDIDTARMVRAVRERLDLRQATKAVEKMTEENKADGFAEPTWEDLLDLEDQKEYTSDELFLRWLQEKLQAKEWGKAKRMMQDGTVKQLEVPVAIAQMVAIANLADALADALGSERKSEAEEVCEQAEAAE